MEWKEHMAKGVSAFRAAQFDAALEHLNKAIALADDQYILYDSRAVVYEKIQRPKDALHDAKKVIDLAPTRWQGYFRAAPLFLSARRPAAALTMADMALARLKPNDAARRTTLAALRADAVRAAEAAAEAERRHAARTATHVAFLPVELLTDVFLRATAADCAAPVTLARVCRHWRAVAHGTPALWGTLVLSRRAPQRKCRAWVERALGRISELRVRTNLDEVMQWPAEQLRGVRWGGLRVLKTHEWDLRTLFEMASEEDQELAALEELEIVDAAPQNVHFASPLAAIQNVRLRSLTVDGSWFDWRWAAKYTTLRTLVLRRIHGADGVDMFAALQALPLLETLITDRSISSTLPIIPPPAPTPLAHLIHLETTGRLLTPAFLAAFTLPALLTLRLDACAPADAALARLAGPDAPRLTELALRRCALAAPTLTAVLAAQPALRTLVLQDTAGADEAAMFLARAPRACPALAHVDFARSDVTTGPLVRMVNARLAPAAPAEAATAPSAGVAPAPPAEGTDPSAEEDAPPPPTPPVTPLASLTVDGCPQIDAEWIPALRSKVAAFSCVYMTKKAARVRR